MSARWPRLHQGRDPLLRVLVAIAAVAALWTAASMLTRAHHEARDARALRSAGAGRDALAGGTPLLAVRPLREAVSLQPTVPAHRLALAEALVTLGRNDEAITYLEPLVADDPVSGQGNLAIARAHRNARRLAEAERFFYRAVYGQWPPEAQDARAQTRLELIALLEDGAEPARVRTELLGLAADFPGDRGLQLHVGDSLTALGFAADAVQVFEGVVSRFADPGPAHAGLAMAQFEAGDYASALAASARAVRAEPGHEAATRIRARASAALALDPTLPRLSVAERTARWRRLIVRARPLLAECGEGAPSPEADQLLAFASTALSPRASPDLAMNAGAAVARAVVRLCPAPAGALAPPGASLDDAVQLVARRVAARERP